MIEDNDFFTRGSSICCGGEMGFWFESGPVKDLTITNNTFTIVAPPLLYALSTQGIKFTGNELFKSNAFKPFKEGGLYLELEACEDITIAENIFTGIDKETLCE